MCSLHFFFGIYRKNSCDSLILIGWLSSGRRDECFLWSELHRLTVHLLHPPSTLLPPFLPTALLSGCFMHFLLPANQIPPSPCSLVGLVRQEGEAVVMGTCHAVSSHGVWQVGLIRQADGGEWQEWATNEGWPKEAVKPETRGRSGFYRVLPEPEGACPAGHDLRSGTLVPGRSSFSRMFQKLRFVPQNSRPAAAAAITVLGDSRKKKNKKKGKTNKQTNNVVL